MKTKLVQIGNSRGIRLPKPLIEQAGLTDEVELEVRDGTIVIVALLPVRSGWMNAAKELRARKSDTLLDEPAATRFDEQEWEW